MFKSLLMTFTGLYWSLISIMVNSADVLRVSYVVAEPYAVLDNGNYSGSCPKYIKKMLDHLKLEYEERKVPWKRALLDGKTDLIACISKNKEREKDYIFSERFIKDELVIVYSNPELKKLKPQTIFSKYRGVFIRGANFGKNIIKDSDFKVNNYKQISSFLWLKRADYTIFSRNGHKLNNELNRFKVHEEKISEANGYIGLRKNSKFLKHIDKINKYLKENLFELE